MISEEYILNLEPEIDFVIGIKAGIFGVVLLRSGERCQIIHIT